MRWIVLLLSLWTHAATGQPLPEGASGWQPKHAVHGARFMVVAAHPLATEAGYAVLALGGSALDAAVAVQMVLGLTEPQSSGPGGGAFLLHWSPSERRLRAYDGRETAPAAARPDRFLDSQGKPLEFFQAAVGGRAVGVPGVLRMLELAHKHHGKRPWRELFQHAILAAEEGFPMTPRLHALLKAEPYLREDAAARSIFYDGAGAPKSVGTRVVNRAYGATMRALAQAGAGSFYEGGIAADIVRAVRSHPRPGDLTEADLAGYRARERPPVCGPYREVRVCSVGPPSAGGVALLQMLGLLERVGFERAAPHSVHAVHLFSEAGRLAFADRARYGGDPDFVAVPVAKLLSAPYLDARAKLIGERSLRTAPAGDTESVGTSHLTIVDAEGNVVAMTSTIENAFGSRIMVRGFLLNNQLTDFAFEPKGAQAPNRVQPGKRPRSSMAPTIVFGADGAARLALGSPGGSAIINYVAKTLVAVIDWGLDIQSAIDVPNHGSRNGPTELERASAYEALVPPLRERGHVLEALPLVSGVHAIERIPRGWRGGADPRREGVARGD